MKAIFCLALLIAVVASERCQQTSDCHLTTCSAGGSLACIRDECTCTTGGGGGGNTCTQQSDCHCQNGTPHCVDGHCQCRN